MDVHAQLAADARDRQQDGVARFVPYRIRHQLAGEQDRDVDVDRDIPGGDRCPDVPARRGCRGLLDGDAARLLLSRRTVATHVSHILKKLDVNSRIDIAREAALRTIAAR